MIKNKKNIPLILGIIIIFIGTLLPSIKIASENISFLKDNGPITIVLVLIMYILLKLEKKQYIFIPSLTSLFIIIKFIIDNQSRIKQINELYNCYASYQYGLMVMIVGNIIIILTLIISLIDFKLIKEKIKKLVEKIRKIIINIIEKIKQKISKLKQEKTKTITHETTKDGKIKFNKIVVKCDNKEIKQQKNKINLKKKINDTTLKLKLRKMSNRKLSISKFNSDYKINEKNKKTITYTTPVIDIKKWTRNKTCCVNCGATISTNSEYCFLCDCKMKINNKQQKIS